MTEYIIIFVTVPDEEVGKRMAEHLVIRKLAACVNIIPKIYSIYMWGETLCSERELLLIIKTRKEHFDKLEEAVRALHPYEIPEIIALPIVDGSIFYMDWLYKNTNIIEEEEGKGEKDANN